MTKPFDSSKPVQTRDGRKARIICTDREYKSSARGENWPILALVFDSKGKEQPISYRVDGTAPYLDDNWTLINLPVERKEYRGVSKGGTHSAWKTSSVEEFKRELVMIYNHAWIAMSETVYLDDEITAINLIKF